MTDPNDPNDPNFQRGKKEEGWKTVVITNNPFAQNAAANQPQPPQGGQGQPPHAGNWPPPQGGQFATPSAPQSPGAFGQPPSGPGSDKTQVYSAGNFAPPPSGAGADKTQVYPVGANFAPPQGPPAGDRGPQPSGPQASGYPPPSAGAQGSGYPAQGNMPPGGGWPPQGPGATPGQMPYPQQGGQPYGAPAKKKSKTWVWVLGIIATVILVCVGGCVAVLVVGAKKVMNNPTLAIVKLHGHMQLHDDEGIYTDSDEAWQAAVPRATSDAMFDQISDKLGKPVSYTQIGTTPEPDAQGLVEIKLNTQFDNGSAVETLVFHKTGKGYKLYHYAIDSNNGVTYEHERVLNP